MSDQPNVQQQPQQGQMTLSDFLLNARKVMDQIVNDYENNMTQMVQVINKLGEENEELKKKISESEGPETI